MTAHSKHPSGSILPLLAASMILLLVMLAAAVDLGWIYLARMQLQNAADAAALAGVAQLIDEDFLTGTPDQSDDVIACRDSAETYAGLNKAAGRHLSLDRNDSNDPNGGIVVGYIEDPLHISSSFQVGGVPEYNSVRVETSLVSGLNGPLELLLGAVTGIENIEIRARSTATVDDRVAGFTLKEGERLNMLPFSIDENYWNTQLQDYWTSGNPMSIYPNDPYTPGNFGTIDIGPPDNSTSDIIYQIQNGVSVSDLAAIGGLVLTDEDGDGVFTKRLQGDTGVSSAIGHVLDDMLGQERLVPLHRNVVNPGNNATFELCGFVAVQIIDVKMTAALDLRYIKVYPRILRSGHAVVNPNVPRSHFVYSALSLTRME